MYIYIYVYIYIYIYIYIRHRASGTMWSVHKALTCRLLLSCPAEHLIRETPLPVLFFPGILHAPRSPHLKKKTFFSNFPDVIFQPFWGSRWTHLGTPKKCQIYFPRSFLGGPGPPPLGPAELQISEKNVECFEREAFFLGGGGPVQPSGGSPLGSPKN